MLNYWVLFMISFNRSISKTRFTLIELLVVVAIIGILASILIPSLARAREATKRAVCKSQLQQIGKAFYMYADDNKEFTPSGVGAAKFEITNAGHNIEYVDALSMQGMLIGNYIDQGASRVFYCPSRNPKDRYGIMGGSNDAGGGGLGWNNFGPGGPGWAGGAFVEGSFNFFGPRQIGTNQVIGVYEYGTDSEHVMGSDVFFRDTKVYNGVLSAAVGYGQSRTHGQDFYNVVYYDGHISGIRSSYLESTYQNGQGQNGISIRAAGLFYIQDNF